jgi:fructokinase
VKFGKRLINTPTTSFSIQRLRKKYKETEEAQMDQVYGGIEAGGTKFVCMVGASPDRVITEARFPTTSPDETIRQAIEFFAPYVQRGELAAVGIASFGPIDLNLSSPTYGFITTTPKPHWDQVDLRGHIQRALNLPIAFDTDVNTAAFGEHYWSPENQSLDPFAYMTVGTGIGVGVIANGRPVHGMVHTEIGHTPVPHNWEKDPFPGICPYHGDCLEGLASGVSMHKRWGQNGETLPVSHPGWDLEAEYIALALTNLIYSFSPQKIVLGGGVPQHAGFHAAVRSKVQQYLNGYIHSPMVLEKIDNYIVPPALGNRSGVLGAIAMAIDLIKT